MTVTTTYCDLCKAELDRSQEQFTFDYALPISKNKDGSLSIRPKRVNLCEDCANNLKEVCESIIARAAINQ